MKCLLFLLLVNIGVAWPRLIQHKEGSLLTNLARHITADKLEHVALKKIGVADGHVVQTTLGQVRGSIEHTTRDGTQYAAFIGIPFAEPPVGKLRFRAPVPHAPWAGIRDSVQEGNSCTDHEDCLVLNVFTPVMEPGPVSSPKAVIVFIYGGAFLSGSSSVYGNTPNFWIDKDVIFASLNYRIGPLGFLSLQNEKVPGNAGLKDQVLALQWIKDNIAAFGGDPSRILIFGNSAGGASVSYLHISPAAKGLFSAAICQSGVSMTPFGYTEPDWAVSHAFNLGGLVGCNETEHDKDQLLECLEQVDDGVLRSLLQIGANTFNEIWQLHIFPFIPTMEPDVPGAIITKPPFEYLSTGDFNHVPIIMGTNSREGIMIYPFLDSLDPTGYLTYLLGKDMSRFIPYKLNITHSSPEAPDLEQSIRDFYFSGDEMTLKHREDLLDLVTDSHFVIDVQRVVLLLAQHSTAPVFNYKFSYNGPFTNREGEEMLQLEGVSHSEENGYMMGARSLQAKYESYDRNSRPHLMIDQMTEMWTNLAKYGKPTTDLNGFVKMEWKPFTTTEHNYLEIGEEISLKQGLNSERMKFWNDMYEKVDDTRPLPD